jgi:hypothetical protein
MLKRAWLWLLYGKVSSRNVATVGDGVVSEVEYRDRWGRVIGYWAYGEFDPSLPYRE